MKNISHTINNATKKLLVAALTLATVSPFSLDAMKRLREEGDDTNEQKLDKKPRTETPRNEGKKITLACGDGTEFQISYKVLSQSITLKNMVHDFIQEIKHQENIKISLPSSISSSTMRDIIRYMNEASFLSCSHTQEHVNSQLIQSIQNTTQYAQIIQNQDPASIIADYIQAAEWLDCELFSHIFETLCGLKCADGVMVTEHYKVLSQSALLKTMFNPEKRFKNKYALNNQKMQMYLDIDINSDIMRIMVKYMNLVAIAKAKGCSKREIILDLIEIINKTTFKYYTVETATAYLIAADYLRFELFSKAFCLLCTQNFDTQEVTSLTLDMKDDQIQKAYYLSHHKHLDIDNPVQITLNDLVDFGTLDDDVMTLSSKLEKCIIHLITTSQYQALQSTLDVFSKYSNSLSIKAHEVLVAHVRSLTKKQTNELFETLKPQGESIIKMALRLVSANDHNEDLDSLECDYFFKNIGNWVNGTGIQRTKLFSQTHLQFVLPLIEPVAKTLVRELDLSVNQLTSLPDSIGNLVNLRQLNLSINQLTSIPDSIGNLVNLTKLNLASNKLTSVPDAIGNLVNLEQLNLASTSLTSVPDAIGNLSNLQHLNLMSNKLTKIPDSICNLVNLKWLLLERNQLTTLPASIGNLVNLTKLNLSINKLTSLPDSIGNLINVKKLSLGKNQLTSLPYSIGSLVNLTTLWLYSNELTYDIKQQLKKQFGRIKKFEI